MSNTSKTPKTPILYPGTKFKDMSGDTERSIIKSYGGKGMGVKDTYTKSGKYSPTIKGEGESGKAGSKMKPSQALEKGGKTCTGGEYSANGTYGKQGKSKPPVFKDYT